MKIQLYLNRSMCRSAACLFAIALLSQFPTATFAWGKFGHVTICEIAYRTTTDTAREKINELIQAHGEYTSFNRACLFADRFPRTRPSAHFINYSRDTIKIDSDECPTDRECLLSAIEDDFYRLQDESLSSKDRGKALILLGHWVGDIHQPLHVSFADDRGGNLIDKSGRCRADNLHAVWDNCIVERRVFLSARLSQEVGWSRFTRAYRAADELLQDADDNNVAELGASSSMEWANESFQIARQVKVDYCVMVDGSCNYSIDNPTLDNGEEKRIILMTDDYLDKQSDTVARRLREAGIRLGLMLTEALVP